MMEVEVEIRLQPPSIEGAAAPHCLIIEIR